MLKFSISLDVTDGKISILYVALKYGMENKMGCGVAIYISGYLKGKTSS